MQATKPDALGEHYYEDDRSGQIYRIKFIDSEIVLLECRGHHRIEDRERFDLMLEEGRFEVTEEPLYANDTETKIPLEEISGIGEVAYESLKREGYTTPADFARVDDGKIKECRGVGQSNLDNIREWVKNND